MSNFPWADFEEYIEKHYNPRKLSVRSMGLAQYQAQGQDNGTFDWFAEYPGAWSIWWGWYDEYLRTLQKGKADVLD